MSDIAKGIRTLLAATTTVTTDTSARIYSDGVVPQKARTYPLVTVNEINGQSFGDLANEVGLVESVVQIDVYAEASTTANAVRENIRRRLAHYSGSAGTETIRRCYAETKRSVPIEPPKGSGQWLYLRSQDYRVFHTESLPTT